MSEIITVTVLNDEDIALVEVGEQGPTGPTGEAGPNTVTTSTTTDITGLLKGTGANVAQAAAGTDYPGLAFDNTFTGNNTFSGTITGQGWHADDYTLIVGQSNYVGWASTESPTDVSDMEFGFVRADANGIDLKTPGGTYKNLALGSLTFNGSSTGPGSYMDNTVFIVAQSNVIGWANTENPTTYTELEFGFYRISADGIALKTSGSTYKDLLLDSLTAQGTVSATSFIEGTDWHETVGTTLTIDLTDGSVQGMTLPNGSSLTITMPPVVAGASFQLQLIQNGTAASTLAWSGGTAPTWIGTEPTMPTGLGDVAIFNFVAASDGSVWYGTGVTD